VRERRGERGGGQRGRGGRERGEGGWGGGVNFSDVVKVAVWVDARDGHLFHFLKKIGFT
jgi:hypothetical protein